MGVIKSDNLVLTPGENFVNFTGFISPDANSLVAAGKFPAAPNSHEAQENFSRNTLEERKIQYRWKA